MKHSSSPVVAERQPVAQAPRDPQTRNGGPGPRTEVLSGAMGNKRVSRVLQTKLSVNTPGDTFEQEADRVAEQVMRMPEPAVQRCACAGKKGGGECEECRKHREGTIARKEERNGGEIPHVTPIVEQVLSTAGEPLDVPTREFMEQRFNRDFSRVRVHADRTAAQSALDISARAYTTGHHVVFSAGEYTPGSFGGRRLLAHELTHVIQQTGHGQRPSQRQSVAGVSTAATAPAARSIQRAPAKKTQADYETLVSQGKWCRDSAKTGKLHPGLQCYREIPAKKGYPPGDQACFKTDTGDFAEDSPDFVSAVSGQNADGTCDIPLGLTDPPNPITHRGRRALGHFISDIATEDADLVGRGFGSFAGIAMGIALPKDGLNSPGLGTVLVPAILGFLGGELSTRGLPLLNRIALRHGFLPTVSLGGGSNLGLNLGVGLEKKDRPLPVVPINTYLTLGFDSSLNLARGSSTFLAKVGVRIDPGKQGGAFVTGSAGGGIAAGRDFTGAASTEVGVGYRATQFLDVQLVRESVTGGGESGTTYWLTLRLSTVPSALKGH